MKIKHPFLIFSLCAFIAITVGFQTIQKQKTEELRTKIEVANKNCAQTIQDLNQALTSQDLEKVITTAEIANCQTPDLNTPLYSMIQHDTPIGREAIRLILKYHPNLDAPKTALSERPDLKETPTPLFLATRHDTKTVVGLLLKAGANPDITNENRESALFAAHNGGVTAALLLQNGANPNLANFELRTPLHAAAYKGEPEVIKLLIEAGADISSRDMYGITPLAVAVVEGRYRAESESNAAEAILNLLKAGADPQKELTQEGQKILQKMASQHLMLWDFITIKKIKISDE